MSLYFTAFIRLGLAVGISTAIQSTFAENVSSFESTFAKVQNDQAQTDIGYCQSFTAALIQLDLNYGSFIRQNGSYGLRIYQYLKSANQQISISRYSPAFSTGARCTQGKTGCVG